MEADVPALPADYHLVLSLIESKGGRREAGREEGRERRTNE